MVRVARSFQTDISGKIDSRVRAAYAVLGASAACAGIKDSAEKDNTEVARKARMNHHGWVQETKNGSVLIPARRFVDVFANKLEFPEYHAEIKAIIKENLKAPIEREWSYADRRVTRQGIRTWEATLVDVTQTQPFGTKKMGPRRLMNKIAEAMESAQLDVIGSDKLPPNRPSTIKKKGKNAPLVDTGELRSSITHWVEEKTNERTG